MKTIFDALGIATGLGFVIASPLVVGTLGGLWLDTQFGTKPMLVIAGMLVGLVGSFFTTRHVVLPFLEKKEE